MPPPPAPPPIRHPPAPPSSTSGSEVHSEGREPKEKEYATFSAQFPPPEWMWYQQQLEKQKRTENWVTHQTSKASTTVGGPQTATLPGSKVTSRPPVPTKMLPNYASGHRKSLISLHHGQDNYVPMGTIHATGEHARQHGPDVVRVGGTHPIRSDNLYESFRNPLPPLPKPRDHHHRKSRDFDSKKSHLPHQHHHHAQDQRQSEYDVIDNPGDVTPLHTSNVYHSVSALSPVIPFNDDSSTYAKLTKQQPQLGPLHSTPRVNMSGQTERTAYRVEGHEARDRIYGPPSHGHHRHRSSKSQRSRRKAQRIYSYYTGGGGAGSDISYEYKGKLPNKNSSRAQSRDSGVNCVGLGKPKGQADPVYENTSKSEPPQSQGNKLLQEKTSPPNHVHFERSAVGEAEGESISHPGNSAYGADTSNQAYNSVIYGGDSTNQAYNSVVYGSMIDMGGGGGAPSVLYGTIATSNLDASEAVMPKNSLQSGYYDDEDSSVPASTLIRCRVEINPTAHVQELAELHSNPESVVDVVDQASPGVPEGSSDGVVEVAVEGGEAENHSEGEAEDSETSEDEENVRSTQYIGKHGVGHDGDDEDTEAEGEDYIRDRDHPRHNSFSEPTTSGAYGVDNGQAKSVQSGNNLALATLPPAHKPSSSEASSTNSCPASRDSGFSSPRNPEGAVAGGNPTNSSGQDVSKQAWPEQRQQAVDEETVGSSDGGLHANSSDFNMASSEQHSGSTTNGDSSCDAQPHSYTKSDSTGSQMSYTVAQHPLHPTLSSVPSTGSSLQQGPSVQYLQPQQRQLPQNIIHMYQPTAMVVSHTDVYNNNSNIAYSRSTMYIEQNPPVPVHLRPNTALLNAQPSSSLAKLSDRELWKQNNAPEELHKFEEEQLAKKYGVNGEFEVMGVL
ncbi:hypothetical protein EGW08_002368 [Elysia chlorotica]|uniref:Uncharacterized protein n=1 Tax=Elysia chlorotica TaxID=188477 RepID=A0A433U7S0_ELYCH|nr:hypothetical protein EGW08_002368 [Elysia chlorotica]